MITFTKINEVYTQLHTTDESLLYELSDEWARFAKNYQHMKLFKKKKWDGKIRYFGRRNGLFYNGLLKDIWESCKAKGYKDFNFVGYDSNVYYTEESILARLETFNLPVELYEYQLQAIVDSLVHRKRIWLSPTSSGKSLIMYCIARLLAEDGLKVLIQVTTTMLANQLENDFIDYAKDDPTYSVEDNFHKITAGIEKWNDKPIYISTWQSINALAQQDDGAEQIADYMAQFDCVINDEVHESDSTVLRLLMESAVNACYRIGLTGTLDDSKSMLEALVGLFGKIVRIKTTKQLMDEGRVSKLEIYPIILEYDEKICKEVHKLDYNGQLDFTIGLESRNKYICNLADKMQGNTVILIRHIGKHAVVLKQILESFSKKRIILIDKDTPSDMREEVRQELENIDDAIIIATYKLMSTGVSIKNLTNVIFASPLKSKIPVIQSIGRILRLHRNKKMAYLFDMVDNMEYNGKKNIFLDHFMSRFDYYTIEDFDIKIRKHKLVVS